ncbi:coronin-1C-like isoform X1 [Watersipora subatra]|uniref:coronin-1C-like isoform X1 n=1 Tax=Watersipora subatra TaxID=2589382 RepID=UPI00355BBA7B
MSVKVVRQSKFRHVFGTAGKKDQWYDGMKITKSNWEGSTYCAVNPKFVALIVESAGGGAFLTIPISKVGRVERDSPVVGGHKADVLDIKWCPHHDDVIASSSEDCTVKIWQIPEEGLKKSLEVPIVDLVYHQRRVGLIEWHPTASNILLSSGADHKLCLWDVGSGEVLSELSLPEVLFSLSFNFNGSKIVSTCKDKKIRIHDARSLKVAKEEKAYAGAKAAQAVFLKDDRIFSTGFSKMSDRQYSLWAAEGANSIGGGEGSLTTEDIDTSNGVMYIFYDPDTSVVYLAGKGDSVIRYFEVVDEAPHVYWLSNYSSSVPQRGIGFMAKRGLNVNNCEISRFYKLAQGTGNQGGYCEPISFTVPRKSELYQDDLYPDTFSGEPSVTSDEWFTEKQDADPLLMSMKDLFSEGGKQKAKVRASILTAGKKKPSSQPNSAQTNGSSAPPTSAASASNDSSELLSEIKRLKIIVMGHEKRIALLEAKQGTDKSESSAVAV